MENKKKIFLSYEEAKEKVQEVGISSKREYSEKYKEIDGLPSSPDAVYQNEWEGWLRFLGKK